MKTINSGARQPVTNLSIRMLRPDDASAFTRLRQAYLAESPLVFASSPEDDVATADAVRQILANAPDSVIIGAFAPELVGVAALYRDPHTKASHKAHIWGMYVAPARRGEGIGAGLLEAAVEHARVDLGVGIVHLCVTTAAPGAKRLYERAGFRVWGTEPDALRFDGQSVDEFYMALRLDSA